MARYEDEVRQILSEGYWSADYLARLRSALDDLKKVTADVADVPKAAWDGSAADAARASFESLRSQAGKFEDTLGLIETQIERARNALDKAATDIDKLPSSAIPQSIRTAVDEARIAGDPTVKIGFMTYNVDTAINTFDSLFNDQREAQAKEARDNLKAELMACETSLESVDSELKSIWDQPDPKPNPDPTPDPLIGGGGPPPYIPPNVPVPVSPPELPPVDGPGSGTNPGPPGSGSNPTPPVIGPGIPPPGTYPGPYPPGSDPGPYPPGSDPGPYPPGSGTGPYVPWQPGDDIDQQISADFGGGGVTPGGGGGTGAFALGGGGAAAAAALRMGGGAGAGGGLAGTPTGTGGLLGPGGMGGAGAGGGAIGPGASGAGGAGAGGGNTGMMAGGGGAGGGKGEKNKRPGTGGHIAPTLEDDEEFIPLSDGAQAGGRGQKKDNAS